MKIQETVKALDLEIVTSDKGVDSEITGGYASDLLSDVLANAQEGNVWVTLQIHQNIVAVASAKDLAGIILVNSRRPEDDTIKKADNEGLPIMVSKMAAFDLIGKLYSKGILGSDL